MRGRPGGGREQYKAAGFGDMSEVKPSNRESRNRLDRSARFVAGAMPRPIKEGSMRKKLRGAPAIVIAATALFVALGGGYAIGKGFIGTGDLKNQSVTNKKIKKNTIKGNRVDEASLSGAGTAQSIRQNT